MTVTGRLTFVSNKSMEIEVLVDATSLVQEDKEKYRAVSAFFTFISLDKRNKPLPVPPLKVGTILPLFSFIKSEHGINLVSHCADNIHFHRSYRFRVMDCLMCPPNTVYRNLHRSLFETLVFKSLFCMMKNEAIVFLQLAFNDLTPFSDLCTMGADKDCIGNLSLAKLLSKNHTVKWRKI